MEKRSMPQRRFGLTEMMMRAKRRDPGGDMPFDEEEERMMEEQEETQ